MNQIPEEEKLEHQDKKKKIFWICGIVFAALLLLSLGIFLILSFAIPEEKEEKVPPKTTEEIKIEPVIGDDEIRGVYIASVANINFPSKQGLDAASLSAELDGIVESARSIGFDTIYFQVRPTSDALYDSSIFPSSRYVTGKEGGELPIDPLEYLIDQAAQYDMKVIAWVNPYRVTSAKKSSKEEALATLSEENPAKKNPDLTVFYDGKLYYNPCLEEVRNLIVSGVREIIEGYEVSGVLYDDYFYPYPAGEAVFDDEAHYRASGSTQSLGDWRREQVNAMIRQTYDAVKEKDPDLTFGVSPFGIWKNASSDPKGSDTRGLEAYHSLYCDALAWIEGGYIDYISPQIYWERGYEAADFATLTRWWSAQVDGTGVGLVISHAAYKAGDFKAGGEELAQQIRYARNYMGSCGSIQYGFADIQKNTAGVKDALTSIFSDVYMEENAADQVTGISFSYPSNGTKSTNSSQFVSVVSDPAYPVYRNGVKLGRTKSGFLSIKMPLSMGENTLTLTQNETDYSLKVIRQANTSTPVRLKQYAIAEVTPSNRDGVIASSGVSIPVSVTAPAGGQVIASLGDRMIALSPTLSPKDDSPYAKEIYEGELVIPPAQGEEIVLLGTIRYTFSAGDTVLSTDGAQVSVIPQGKHMFATVTKDYAHIKRGIDSSFYDDFTPASVGMCEEVDAVYDGYCRLIFGGFVSLSDVQITLGEAKQGVFSHIIHRADEKNSNFVLDCSTTPAVDAVIEGKRIAVTFFSTGCETEGKVSLSKKDSLFSSAKMTNGEEGAKLLLELKDEAMYFGFHISYGEGKVTLSFRQPSTLSKGEKPLSGKVIAIDAGHGGEDFGALGFVSYAHEKDLNLAIALSLRDQLEDLGARVHMIREGDETVALADRMTELTRLNPDFSVSVHHNSANEAGDANLARGALSLYWSKAGTSLASSVGKKVSIALSIPDQGAREQELAMCRNHRFPQMLLETSFICNPAEYEGALRSSYAQDCATAIKDGIMDWYRLQEKALKGE